MKFGVYGRVMVTLNIHCLHLNPMDDKLITCFCSFLGQLHPEKGTPRKYHIIWHLQLQLLNVKAYVKKWREGGRITLRDKNPQGGTEAKIPYNFLVPLIYLSLVVIYT